jgi:hypothetical protein
MCEGLLQKPAASRGGEIVRPSVDRGFLLLPRLSANNSIHFLQKTFSMAQQKVLSLRK